MGRHSSSDSDGSGRNSSFKRKKKSGSRKRRSRSSSYESSRRKHGKSRRKSRSRSTSSDRNSRRRRSRSRDVKRRKKSRDRSTSPIRRKKHVDAVMGISTGTLKDVMDIVPGFSKMTPSEQSRIRVQRALQAAVENVEENQESPDATETKEDLVSVREQIDRAKAIQAIDDVEDDHDVDFLPSHFRSSNKGKKSSSDKPAAQKSRKTFVERESNHEMAIFGHASMLTLDQALKRKQETDHDAIYNAKKRVDFKLRDPKTLVASELLATPEELAKRWRAKLLSLRQRFIKDLEP